MEEYICTQLQRRMFDVNFVNWIKIVPEHRHKDDMNLQLVFS